MIGHFAASRVIAGLIGITGIGCLLPYVGFHALNMGPNGVKLAVIIVLAVSERVAIRRGW